MKPATPVPEQLAAVRKAAKVPAEESHSDPEVNGYVQLRDKDIKAFQALRERLEREHAARVSGGSNVAALPHLGESGPADDGYDKSKDTVTPKLEAMIEAWLIEMRAKVEDVCPCCKRPMVEGKS